MRIELAEPRHERALRELLRESSMPGWIRLAFGREPDFFHGAGVQGKTNEALVTLDGARALGMGCRSVKPMFVNGKKMDFGYLHGLRLHPDARRTSLLARGYAELKRLHENIPVPAYLTTVIEDNSQARALLTSGRAGLPHYIDRGRYITHAIQLNARRRKYDSPYDIRNGNDIGIKSVIDFIHEAGRTRQFFPAIKADDFGTPYLRGLNMADFRIALKNNEILGVASVWNQSAFKQNLVKGYAAPIRFSRPILNLFLRMSGFCPLPAPGEKLNSPYIAFACVRDNDPEIMRALLEHIYYEYQRNGAHFLLLGMHEDDPLTAVSKYFSAFHYVSRFYLVCWDDGLDFVKRLDPALTPHLELATL